MWAVVSLALAGLILSAFVSRHDRRALWKHYQKPANLDSWVSRDDEA
jgi:hypothetical protein